ncbi:pbn1 protein [Zalerion maritima]|uniref:Protein PBN1 n=1 Tax=Zalerion maritima TaxID=339359 RepID=A0AAD5S091_9PEZI|nr:pbn1 protein [Zalerion maritima]
MRQRTTFFHTQENAIDPENVVVSGDSIQGPDIQAVREDRLTLQLEELPEELAEFLGSCQGFHVRWISCESYDTVTPLVSRLPPGLHVFYTPQKDQIVSQPCTTLQSLFGGGVACVSLEDSFIELPRHRFAHSPAYQYYSPLSDLTQLVESASKTLCGSQDESSPCVSEVKRLNTARSLDFSYDAESKTIKTTAAWPQGKQGISVSQISSHRIEVGILTTDSPPNLKPHEQGIAGLLTVLGESTKPTATLFAFSSRHRKAEGNSFSTAFLEPTGLHPTIQIKVVGLGSPLDGEDDDGIEEECGLYAYFTLPRHIFADSYQLADPLFLASKNLTTLSFMSQPVNLEAPEYVMDVWGSSLLLQLAPPTGDDKTAAVGVWTAEVPLHLRYLDPKEGGYTNTSVPYPALFWACSAEEGAAFARSPFERVNLGYDGLFEPNTAFWHVDPTPLSKGGKLLNEVTVPVADLDQAGWVSAGTAFVIFLGFGWIVGKLVVAWVDKKAPATEEKKTQ